MEISTSILNGSSLSPLIHTPKTVTENGRSYLVLSKTVSEQVPHGFFSTGHSLLFEALDNGIEVRAKGGFASVAGLLITPITILFTAAIDALIHTFKAAINTLQLPSGIVKWVFAKDARNPVQLTGDVLTEASRAVVSAALAAPAAAFSVLSPDTTLALTTAFGLTPRKIVVRTFEERGEEITAPAEVTVTAKIDEVQGLWARYRQHYIPHTVLLVSVVASVAIIFANNRQTKLIIDAMLSHFQVVQENMENCYHGLKACHEQNLNSTECLKLDALCEGLISSTIE